ncbi:MAG: DNA translocase FtsK [Oscillospiraceae bacterium]|nr:DNA translocase FtsK [Oscillospiraceae bacterium]
MANSTKGAKKKTAAPKGGKRAPRASAADKEKKAPPMRRELGGIACLLLAIVVIAGFFADEGTLIYRFAAVLKGLVGWGYYILTPAFLIAAWILIFHRGRPVTFRLVSALLLPILFANIASMSLGIAPSGYSGTSEYLAQLYQQGIALRNGGVFGAISILFRKIGFPNAISFALFIILFIIFAIKAIDYDIMASFRRVKERASVPYDPADYEEDEVPVREKLPEEKRVMRPQRVPDPKVATALAQKPRTYSGTDIPIGEEGEPLTVGQLDDLPDQSFGAKTTRAKVRRKSAPETKPEELAESAAEKPALVGRDIGDNWTEYRPDGKAPTAVKVSPSVPVAAEISDPPKKERIKREEIEKERENIAQSIKPSADAADEYVFPPLDLLSAGIVGSSDARDEVALNRERLDNAIRSFGISAAFVGEIRGPTVTRYDFELEQGVKLSRVTNLAGDLALALGVINVRIAPITEKISTVGIEVPNKIVSTVYLRTILESQRFQTAKSRLSFAVGKDIGGDCIVGNIAKLPHMLIAGTTGSGKSVYMNSLILSLLYKARPDEVKFIMIDPKMVELGIYSGIPHMLTPVVTEPKKAAGALQWAVVEMLKRYRLFSECGVRDIEGYNRHCEITGEEKLAQVVVVIDELADLMMIAAKEVEESICRVAQMGRAAGMHLVVATQRPSADVITGLMKANIPSRIAFAVSSAMESRIIMDQSGAEKLVGMGDMLYSPLGAGKPTRVQGAFVSDEERERVIEFIKENNPTAKPENNQEIGEYMTRAEQNRDGSKDKGREEESGSAAGDYDEMLPQAVEAILETKQCSVSMLQRRVKLGYSRAARIVDQMEELGIVGPYEGAKPRSVLVDRAGWLEIQAQLGLSSDGDLALAAGMNEDNDDL